MTEIKKMKLLLDYNEFIEKCVSKKDDINKQTIRDYFEGNYYHEPIKL
ncbi:hypothetical protein AVT43_gp65 [Polaribacter phage P12002L]|uniref:Uncharacterized protein n=2 Tax=Incheonvirus TaxID=2976977 RepID=A0A0F7IND5_9CAUD|nr:hypothetical protein AVT42_gp67 [Polaribacter phage P12002S]YP_009209725.1 hypothetical protein AVT43_gp65 [Polaribacter phage P12002L]AKG94239.1 hypothetical protein P12002L_0065 [Polaribacter phage P12002L]AKG94323.1 hypothetical protein P12002S_0067 [Polaribacter phage P12002S]